jgi:DNA-directed RNA polymerase subunit M/transcription elongation factor TFIIS
MLCCGNASEDAGVAQVLTPEARSHAISVIQKYVGPNAYLRHKSHRSVSNAEFAGAIEHGIAIWSEGKSKQYGRKLYSILYSIRKDPTVFKRFDPWDLAYVKEEVLMVRTAYDEDGARSVNSDLFETVVKSKISALEEILKARVSKASGFAKSRTCPRCGSSDLERIALQLRSADEGMTTMMQCTGCSHRFK